MNLMRRAGHRIWVSLNNCAELILNNHREGERPIKFDMAIAIVLIQHTFKCRAGVFENVVVEKHIAQLHVDQGRIEKKVFWC